MSIDFFERLTMSEGTYVHQMSCTRKDFPTKISLKMHFWKDLRGVLKKSFILKDPVLTQLVFLMLLLPSKRKERFALKVCAHCTKSTFCTKALLTKSRL